MSRRLAERASSLLGGRTTRRDFLTKTAVVGSAIAVAPRTFVLRPVTAYEAVCGCAGRACACGSLCCDGYTEFCCTLTGENTCPPGSFAGGWWKASGSVYCSGDRYYIDCVGNCTHCTSGCGGGHAFCVDTCGDLGCGCALGNCSYRKAGCTQFRYGQCHQEIACSTRILCRVVSCDPAVLVFSACSGPTAVDDATANHNQPCLQASPTQILEADLEHGMAVDVVLNPSDPTSGYTLDRWGGIHPFGNARSVTIPGAYWPGQDVARRMLVTDWNTPAGYVLDLDGALHPFGGAPRVSTSYWSGGWIVPISEL